MPWEADLAFSINWLKKMVVDVLEVLHSCVLVFLSREVVFLFFVRRLSERVVAGVPTAKAEVESSHESQRLIDDAELAVVGPEDGECEIGVPQHADVGVETLEVLLSDI